MVPAQWARPANDGEELQLLADGDGSYKPSVSKVDPAQQLRALGKTGHLNPTKIIIGMPPYPELEAAAAKTASVKNGSVQIPGAAVPTDTWQQLFNGQAFTISNDGTTKTTYGNAVYPYDASQPYGAGNNIAKPSQTNHQWLSIDFVTHSFAASGAHFGVILYRWRQLFAQGGGVGNVYPLVGAGAIAGDLHNSSAGCGGPGGYVGGASPWPNTQIELFGRHTYMTSYDPYALVTPAYSPNQDPWNGSILEIPPSSNPYAYGGNIWSPSCSLNQLSDETSYRMIVHASDGGYASYFLYVNIGGSWQLLASPSTGASPNGTTGTSYRIAPTNYTTPTSTYTYNPWSGQYDQFVVYRDSPTSQYGTFNANMGGFAIGAAFGKDKTWSIDFSNVQFGACLEGSNCYY